MDPNKEEKKKPDPSPAEKGIIDELQELRKSMADIQALLIRSAEEKKAQDTKEKEDKGDGELKY